MKILVTGAAGFIGFNFCDYLLKDANFNIVGIDNLNNYYDVNLKKKRVKFLNKNKKFIFIKIDLTDRNKLDKIF